MALALNDPIVTDVAEWRKLALAVLKGADFETVLTSKTADGLHIEPLYARADGFMPIIGRAPGAAWSIMQRVDNPDAPQANAQALNDLETGATGLTLVFENAIGSHGFGLPAKAGFIEEILRGIYLDAGIDIALDCGPRGRDAAHAFADACKALGFPPNTIRVRFGLNPVGTGGRIGVLQGDGPAVAKNVAAAVNDLLSQGFSGPFLAADGRVVHAAGGSEAQELAFTLSSALFYLRALEASGLSLDDARVMIEFRLATDADQFLSIAKHRALRRLWASIESQCGLVPKPLFLSSEIASRMMTRQDSHVNLLRAGMGCFASAIGGANAITVLPFTTALGLPDPFARRLARNTQLVLLEEAHLAKVTDPVAGAGVYEALTDALVTEAWQQFQQIEAEGGMVASLKDGQIQSRIAQICSERIKALAEKKNLLIGINAFKAAVTAPVETLAPTPPLQPPTAAMFTPLTPVRLSEAFEAINGAEGSAQ